MNPSITTRIWDPKTNNTYQDNIKYKDLKINRPVNDVVRTKKGFQPLNSESESPAFNLREKNFTITRISRSDDERTSAPKCDYLGKRSLESSSSSSNKRRFMPNRIESTKRIKSYCEKGEIEKATHVFEQMKKSNNESCQPNIYTYNTLIQYYLDKGLLEGEEFGADTRQKAWQLRAEASSSVNPACHPNYVTNTIFLKNFCDRNMMLMAEVILKAMEEQCRPDETTYGTMITAYCRLNNLEKACDIFHKIKDRVDIDIKVSAHILINSLYKDNLEKAEEFFKLAKLELHELLSQDGGTCFDLHGYTKGSALIAVKSYFSQYPGWESVQIITGRGNHSNNELYNLRNFLILELPNFCPDVEVSIHPSNQGVLIIKNRSYE